jgi:hypothetical protein
MAMREADLDRHLVGEDEKKAADALKAKLDKLVLPEDKTAKGSVAGTSASINGAVAKATKSAAETDQKPVEYSPLNGSDGKPIDFVLQQALNQLKGLPVAASPRALLANAGNNSARAAPKAIEAKK